MAVPGAEPSIAHPTMWYRGVAYDTGTNFQTGQGALSRMSWTRAQMLQEIALTSDELYCNSLTIYGSDLERLAEAAQAAVDRDLHVWLQPRLTDRPQEEILEHLAGAARIAESLRAQGARISLTVGAVHLVFTPGLIAGEKYHDRMANIYAEEGHHLLVPTADVDVAAAAPALNEFLARAAAVAREHFSGELSYSAAPFEDVDWSLFDTINLMYHYLPKPLSRQQHLDLIEGYRHWNKPILIAEFGTATYQGAEQKGFFFWDIVDRSQPVPTILDGYVRDEGEQAAYHLRMFDLFEGAGVSGVAVSELIHPTHPHSDDPKYDLDTASMGIVKTIREDMSDPGSAYRIEPKEAFHAIAGYYAHAGFQAIAR